jgi:serine protease DegS
MTQIIEKGYVARGWLGIEAQDLTPQLARTLGLTHTKGMLIGSVINDGPAANAGLQHGDIVVAINGEPVAGTNEAMKAISGVQPGTTIKLSGLRKGLPFTAQAKVIQRPGRNTPVD